MINRRYKYMIYTSWKLKNKRIDGIVSLFLALYMPFTDQLSLASVPPNFCTEAVSIVHPTASLKAIILVREFEGKTCPYEAFIQPKGWYSGSPRKS